MCVINRCQDLGPSDSQPPLQTQAAQKITAHSGRQSQHACISKCPQLHHRNSLLTSRENACLLPRAENEQLPYPALDGPPRLSFRGTPSCGEPLVKSIGCCCWPPPRTSAVDWPSWLKENAPRVGSHLLGMMGPLAGPFGMMGPLEVGPLEGSRWKGGGAVL